LAGGRHSRKLQPNDRPDLFAVRDSSYGGAMDRFSWMVGRWTDGTVEEQWFPAVAGRMIGINRHLASGFFEYLRIELREGEPVYVASPMGGAETAFPMASCGGESVLFQNPAHDFPTDIAYRRDGPALAATASNSARRAQWTWEPAAPPAWTVHAGRVGWIDLTVPAADASRDFYCAVLGFTSAPTEMGGYADHSIVAPDGAVVAGICHARGDNADIPPGWLPYFVVADVEAAVDRAVQRGATVVASALEFTVLQDPTGVGFALYEA
jgi:uncharacterized protein